VQPLLGSKGRVSQYAQGSWGPGAAARLLRDGDHWREPWAP